MTHFIVHQHRAGRRHFDLRVAENGLLRCWSMLREPPARIGEQRLAIERESFPITDAGRHRFTEQAFGEGPVFTWDSGEVNISIRSPRRLRLQFQGARLCGSYELRKMKWYPGNRWLLEKVAGDKIAVAPPRTDPGSPLKK